MRRKDSKQKVSKGRKGLRKDYVPWYKPIWLADVSAQSYGLKEKTTMRKVMIPGSFIIKLWKRIFK